ncbi:MAG TPA: hypothetical protein VNA20_01565 [Frankiaceae bacterium]|nr:hypothetical protein [Frankiaceae bacterium]
MELTRYDRERLAELLGAVSLAGHAVPLALLTKEAFSIPMEAGGLFLAPLLGGPALFGACALVVHALLLAVRRRGAAALGGLVLTLAADVVVLATIAQLRHPLLVTGALLSATSLGLFLSLVKVDLGDRERSDMVVTVVGFLLAGTLLAIVVPRFVAL